MGRRRDGGGKERNRSRKGKDRGSASVVAEECEGDGAIRGGETKREREREGEWRGEGRRKRQIEVESGRRRGGMLLPLWSFASSGAAGETILREGNNILNRI